MAERLAGLGGMGLGHCRMLPTSMEKQETCKHGMYTRWKYIFIFTAQVIYAIFICENYIEMNLIDRLDTCMIICSFYCMFITYFFF